MFWDAGMEQRGIHHPPSNYLREGLGDGMGPAEWKAAVKEEWGEQRSGKPGREKRSSLLELFKGRGWRVEGGGRKYATLHTAHRIPHTTTPLKDTPTLTRLHDN